MSFEGRKRVSNPVREKQSATKHERATAICNIRDIAVPCFPARSNKWFDRTRQHFCRVVFIEHARAEAIIANGSDAMADKEPAFVDFDWRTADSGLHEFPGPPRRDDNIACVPIVEIVGLQQLDVFVIVAVEHRIMVVYATWK